jgi:type I restriction enzyme S subunit
LRKTIPLPRLLSAYIYLPPADEQQAIVDFLDKAVEKIDRYIAAKEAEIEKLGTLKQSVISQAVTKGLNPNAPMKNSKIPWLGDIPKHWEVKKIREHFQERKEKVSDKDFAPLSVAKIGVVPQLEDACKTDNGDNRKLIKKNDFVINSRSDRRGSCGISEYDGSWMLGKLGIGFHWDEMHYFNDIKYVHDLQNIMRELGEKELIIK